MLIGTVGVAPGSYTFNVPRNLNGLGDCVQQPNGPINYGLPAWGWYDQPNATYSNYFLVDSQPHGQSVDPYGTDSQLKGLGAVDPGILTVGLLSLGAIGIALHFLTRKKRR